MTTPKKSAKGKRWKPKENETFYALYFREGYMEFIVESHSFWRYSFPPSVIERFVKQGNCFKTKREATVVCKKLNQSIRSILKGGKEQR